MMNYKFDDNTILVVNSNIKNKVIEEVRNNSFLNIKFMSLEEMKNNFYFSYDVEALYYVMDKYKCKFDIASTYLSNLIYIDDDYEYNDSKLIFLSELKKELNYKKLLKYNKLFVSSLKNYNVVIYNYGDLLESDQRLINDLEGYCNVSIYNDEKKEYIHKNVYEFNEIEDEVIFVANRICELIKNGVDINNIKICGINDEYNNYIKKYFKFFNININLNNSYLYATSIAKDFLDNFDSLDKAIKFIKDKYKFKSEGEIDIYNAIVNIINKYVWLDDVTLARELIIHDFKRKKINIKNYANSVEIINSLDEASDSDYIFLMSFNQGIIPNTYKDEDFLSDKLKHKLGIEDSNRLNEYTYNKWFLGIKSTKNIVITYKLHSLNGDYYLSNLNDDLNLEILHSDLDFKYSNLYNRIKLAEYIDTFVKYNLQDDNLGLLYNNYKDLNYMIYNNKYNKVDIDKVKKYLDNKLVLSYSAIDNYYHCAFRYYLSNILRLNIYEETFYTVLGNLFHYILSICFDSNINLVEEYYKYIDKQTYEFNSRELFFLDNLFSELVFIINTIKEQYEYCSLNNSLYEDRIEVDKSKNDMSIIFKGFVDKIMFDDKNGIGAIIDYKTGNPNLNLNNIIYGIDLQLPVYVYLTKKKFPNIRIVGFYLQKILHGQINRDSKKDYLDIKKDNLKLQGYSNSDEIILKEFDSEYQNSKVISGMRTNAKGIASKKILDDIQIDKLASITDDKIEEVIDAIMDASFDINPKRIGMDNIGCKYCKFKDICFMNEVDIINLEEYKNMEFLYE